MADWTIDLEAGTATHPAGWVFKFSPAAGTPGAFDGACIGQPANLTPTQIASAARLAREAGDAYIKARADRH